MHSDYTNIVRTTLDRSDGVKHIGHHTIFFTFEFDGKKYYFARNTGNASQKGV